jgi:hypothetical protein
MQRQNIRHDSERQTAGAVETARQVPCQRIKRAGRVMGLVLLALVAAASSVWAQEAAARVSAGPLAVSTPSRAQQYQRHQALWAACRSCLIETPAGSGGAAAMDGAPPRATSPYGTVPLEGQPAAAIVEGRIATVTAGTTADGRGVFTDYEVVVTHVAQDSALLPVAVGATLLVTRPGGEVAGSAARRTVRVAGYPRLDEGAQVLVTLVAIPDVGSYQEVRLQPVDGKGGRP